jgi:glyceraldehyde 3-phosphate dehydrogenase
VTIDLKNAPGVEKDIISSLKDTVVRIPVTQAVIYGWYDNEMASYVNLLGDRIVSIAENI